MANTIIIKNGAGAPPDDALAVAELGFDTENKKLYIGHKDGIVDLNSSGVTIDLEGAEQGNIVGVNAEFLKPQSPLSKEGVYFYPLTTADQIILDDNSRLNQTLEQLVYTEEYGGDVALTGRIKTLFTDSARTEVLFPRTSINAVTDENGTSLKELINNQQALIDNKQKKRSVSLLASNWSDMTQIVSVDGVTEDNSIIPVPAPENHIAYCEFGVYCLAQANGKLTFVCAETPTVDLIVNVLILN